jgi:multiple sugar transport system ATP-binding protein
MASLSIKDVRKSYGALDVLHGIDIELEDGGFLVLVGPSGCGKSTLLNLIAGLDDASGGDILIDGRSVLDLAPKDRDIAMVFQSYALYPTMSVERNIGFGLEMRGVDASRRKEATQRAADLLQIGHLLDRRPANLSGGQRQRVAMGRAIVRDPALFLFDEPLSNLDAKLRVEMRTEIKRLHERLGTSVVYVTHDQVEAMTLGTKVAVMKDGRVQQLADPRTIYERPANMFVGGFIGSPSMNFLRGTLSVAENDTHLFTAPSITVAVEGVKALSTIASGHPVVLGIRPESLRIVKEADPNRHVSGTIDVVEPTGPETLVAVSIGTQALTARVAPRFGGKRGEPIFFEIDRSSLSVFDAETEAQLIH